MNTDIRLQVSFRDHPKRIKLERRLGAAGPLALIDLWLSVAQSKPNGCLHGWSEEDIAIAAKWHGAAATFVSTLVELRLLDLNEDGSFSIHDWNQHNGYAAGAPERSERARAAARARWDRATEHPKLDDCNAGACHQHCYPHAPAMPMRGNSNAPTYQRTNVSVHTTTHGRTHAPEEADNGVCISSFDGVSVGGVSVMSQKSLLELVPKEFRVAAEKAIHKLAHFGNEHIAANIRYCNEHAKTNYIAYLKKAIKENYADGWEETAQLESEKRKAIEELKPQEDEERRREEQEYSCAQMLFQSLTLQEKNLLREEILQANPFLSALGEKAIRRLILFRLCESARASPLKENQINGEGCCEGDLMT